MKTSGDSRLRHEVLTQAALLFNLPRLRLSAVTLVVRLFPPFTMAALRKRLYRFAGCRISSGATILGPMELVGPGNFMSRLRVEDGAIIGPGVTFGLDAEITVGRGVSISPHATLYTASHAVGFGSRRMNPQVQHNPIVIHDGAWIGMHCLILPGVTIGQGAVVSAGSVVMEDVPPNALVAGNPAVVLRTLPFGDR